MGLADSSTEWMETALKPTARQKKQPTLRSVLYCNYVVSDKKNHYVTYFLRTVVASNPLIAGDLIRVFKLVTRSKGLVYVLREFFENFYAYNFFA